MSPSRLIECSLMPGNVVFIPIRAGKDGEFREWFASTNEQSSMMIVDNVLEPMEPAHLPYKKGRSCEDYTDQLMSDSSSNS